MKGNNHSENAQEAKQSSQSRRVSSRAYNKKDFDYLSTFPRVAHSTALKTSTIQHVDDVELRSHEPSDGESDLFMTTSSVDYTNSLSSVSSTSSSAQSSAKYNASLTDMESDHHQQHQSHSYHHDRPRRHHRPHRDGHHKHHHDDDHLQLSDMSSLSPRNFTENRPDLQTVNEEKSGSESNLELKDKSENDSVERKEAPIKLRPKVRSKHIDTPAVLPKFGSWDTKNPSSGEAYTLIFKRLRDEKKSGAVPVCGSPTHPKSEEVDEPLELESKAKEPLCPNSCARKDFSRRKGKTTSHQEATPYRMVT
ncbi:hypothetical protein GOP47_0027993 [Adiantum capillus-veneris]|nr:hypothetical protein GOP47_0027993 [Adiantum capillus-veneris]